MNRNMKAINWAMEVRGLDPGPWRLLMVLCSHVGKRDYCVWPSLKTMAEKAEISRPSAKRFIGILIDRGFIEHVEVMWRENGGRSSNKYRIKVGEIAVIESDDEEEDDYVSQSDPRVNLTLAPGHSYDPGPRVTGEPSREPLLERTSQLEDSSLSTKGPSFEGKDLFGGSGEIVDKPFDLVQWIEDEWCVLKAEHPGIAGIRKIDDGLAHTIRLRTEQHKVKGESERDVWERVFAEIRSSRFLQGRVPPSGGRENPFKLTLSWLVKAAMFREVINGKYSRSSDDGRYTDRSGNPLSPSDQAAAGEIERILARKQSRAR